MKQFVTQVGLLLVLMSAAMAFMGLDSSFDESYDMEQETNDLPGYYEAPNKHLQEDMDFNDVFLGSSSQQNQNDEGEGEGEQLLSLQEEEESRSEENFDSEVNQINWCNVGNCGSKHIACRNNGAFARNCNKPSQVFISSALRLQILQLHNDRRNRIALGKVSRFQTARRMGQMVWNSDLAKLAELNTKTCRMQHDACRNTPAFKYSGQNLGVYGVSNGHLEPSTLVSKVVDMWFNEHPYASQSDINKLTRISNNQGRSFGHFTAMISERNIAVGCAISRYFSNGFYYSLMACNYASTNMIGSPVYRTGNPASGCKRGADNRYRGLCKTNEPIDPNSFN